VGKVPVMGGEVNYFVARGDRNSEVSSLQTGLYTPTTSG